MIITIDGPVASGKSTAARNLAAALGFEHLDSGAVYRSLTLLARQKGVKAADSAAVRAILAEAKIAFRGERVLLDGVDVTEEIRDPEITETVRPFAENPDVRAWVNDLQRETARGRDIVVEGRDMGTVVFPEADLKLFLSTSAEERARRRFEELASRGTPVAYETVLGRLVERDRADRGRKIAPLRKAVDAVEIDSAGWAAEETLARLVEIVRERLGEL